MKLGPGIRNTYTCSRL